LDLSICRFESLGIPRRVARCSAGKDTELVENEDAATPATYERGGEVT